MGEITGTYGDDLSFKFKLNSNYSLGDVTAAGGGTAATAVISGPDADDNYTASFTASQIKGALSEPSAELTITISTEAND
ncbi:MAG: hypothetical protein MJ219_03745 [Mycoplasmoidaceae bacterium]|nr:hypothetical protein [Mycoplasmoidaceae bacterium]